MMIEDYSDEKIVKEMIRRIGEDTEREGLIDTPKRVVKMWKEIFRGYDEKQKPKVTTFTNGSDGIDYDEMICDTGDFYSHCSHHMVPFIGKYYFAYIPSASGKILGLSKVGRVVDYFSAKLQIQEQLVNDIVNEISSALGEVKGIALVMEAEHLCKTMRGVKKKGKMRTTKLIGAFKDDPSTRQEFMNWVNKNV